MASFAGLETEERAGGEETLGELAGVHLGDSLQAAENHRVTLGGGGEKSN